MKQVLEEVKIQSRKGQTIVRRKVTDIQDFGRSGRFRCQKGTMTLNGEKVSAYIRDDQRYWSLDMFVVL